MFRIILSIIIALFISLICNGQDKISLKLKKLATGFTSPVGIACPDDGTGRIFIFEQRIQ